jgi:hypothetical protein
MKIEATTVGLLAKCNRGFCSYLIVFRLVNMSDDITTVKRHTNDGGNELNLSRNNGCAHKSPG